MHLAELNIGRLKALPGDPRIAEFVDNLDRINALAERSPGFVWRLVGAGNDALDIPWVGDPSLAVNMSVWETPGDLARFTFLTAHRQFYARREAWFELLEGHHFVMWWVPEGHIPTLEEAAGRLERLKAGGPSEEAFGWESLPEYEEWRALRCA